MKHIRGKAALVTGASRGIGPHIVRDEPEVVLSGKPMLPFLLAQTLSPRLAARMSAMVGVPAMFRKWAEASLAQQRRPHP